MVRLFVSEIWQRLESVLVGLTLIMWWLRYVHTYWPDL